MRTRRRRRGQRWMRARTPAHPPTRHATLQKMDKGTCRYPSANTIERPRSSTLASRSRICSGSSGACSMARSLRRRSVAPVKLPTRPQGRASTRYDIFCNTPDTGCVHACELHRRGGKWHGGAGRVPLSGGVSRPRLRVPARPRAAVSRRYGNSNYLAEAAYRRSLTTTCRTLGGAPCWRRWRSTGTVEGTTRTA